METQSKICLQCENNLPISEFYRDFTRYTIISYRSKCKKCCAENNLKRKSYEKNNTIENKKCITCGENKEIKDYYKSTRHLDGYFKSCIKCTEIKRKNKGNNIRVKRTPEYMIQYLNKRKENPNYKMRYALRSNLSKAVCRIQGGVKSKRTQEYLGCSLEFFKHWFEFLFDNDMNWQNHGSVWHIDHIKPCSSFDLKEQDEIYECYNWSNLRPLKKEENLAKGDIVDNVLIDEYKCLKEAFLSIFNDSSAP